MKSALAISMIGMLLLAAGCTKQPYYEIPRDANGNVVITDVSKATSDGITTLDDGFTVTATVPNAKAGESMTVELLKLQAPPEGGSEQLFPLSGTQKEVTVSDDLKVAISYTRTEAQLNEAGDYVVVTFAGKTESAQLRIDMTRALTVSSPRYEGMDVDIIRSAGTAFFTAGVTPQSGSYSGDVTVRRKNGVNEAWTDLGSFPAPAVVPVSGDDFAAGKDTMYYSFSAKQGSFVDEVVTSVVVNDPYFLVKKAGSLSLDMPDNGGMNLLDGSAVPAGSEHAVIAVDHGSLVIKGGEAWATDGKSISFVPATAAMYDLNNSRDAIEAFQAGTPVATADPVDGEGVFIFKIVNGSEPEDTIYGLLKITAITPGAGVAYEYRIGNIYAHLAVVE